MTTIAGQNTYTHVGNIPVLLESQVQTPTSLDKVLIFRDKRTGAVKFKAIDGTFKQIYPEVSDSLKEASAIIEALPSGPNGIFNLLYNLATDTFSWQPFTESDKLDERIYHKLPKDYTSEADEMYIIYGDLDLNGFTFTNNGKIVIVDGTLIYNGGTINGTGTVTVVSQNLGYVLAKGNKTLGNEILWSNTVGNHNNQDSIASINAEGGNVYITKEWVNRFFKSSNIINAGEYIEIEQNTIQVIVGNLTINSGGTLINNGKIVVIDGTLINNGTLSGTGIIEYKTTSNVKFYTETFTPGLSNVINHNLNTKAILVQLYEDDKLIQADEVITSTVNSVTVEFGTLPSFDVTINITGQ